MMKQRIFRRGLALVFVFVVSFSAVVSAQEMPSQAKTATAQDAQALKPVLTISIASPEALLQAAEKIAALTGTTDQFNEAIQEFKGLEGLSPKSPTGIVLRSDGTEFKEPLVILPIASLDDVKIPFFDILKAGAQKQDDGTYLLNSPLGEYVAAVKGGSFMISTAGAGMPLPEKASDVLSGMDKMLFGLRFDAENTTIEAMEAALAFPQMLIAMQGGEQGAQAMEMFNKQLEVICNEVRSTTFGIAFDPKSAEINLLSVTVPKPDSDTAKMLKFMKGAKTSFDAFAGGNDAVFSYSEVAEIPASAQESAEESFELFSQGIMSSVEENMDDEEDLKEIESLVASAKDIFMTFVKQKTYDVGFSLANDGTILAGANVTPTTEVKNLVAKLIERFKKDHGDEVDNFFKDNLKADFSTVEGYSISVLALPLDQIAAAFGVTDAPSDILSKKAIVFWGIKDGAAIAFAAGFDVDKTEKTFIDALKKSSTPVALRSPQGMISLKNLGLFLKSNNVGKEDPTAAKVVAKLAGSPDEAKITFSEKNVDDAVVVDVNVNGKVVAIIADIWQSVKDVVSGGADLPERNSIQQY